MALPLGLAATVQPRPVRLAAGDAFPAPSGDYHPIKDDVADYRNPNQLPPGRVLVVGAANSGLQIAAELAATQPVTVAVGTRPTELPSASPGGTSSSG